MVAEAVVSTAWQRWWRGDGTRRGQAAPMAHRHPSPITACFVTHCCWRPAYTRQLLTVKPWDHARLIQQQRQRACESRKNTVSNFSLTCWLVGWPLCPSPRHLSVNRQPVSYIQQHFPAWYGVCCSWHRTAKSSCGWWCCAGYLCMSMASATERHHLQDNNYFT